MKSYKIDILTLFPQMFIGPFSESLLQKGQENGLLDIKIHNLRDFSKDRNRKVDDKPFGGGPGMVLKVEPIYRALKSISALPGKVSKQKNNKKPYIIHLSPQGKKLTQPHLKNLITKEHIVLICGHYEGIDQRAVSFVDEEISIGDYVLTGGEIPAMVLIDALARLVPGVVKERESVERDSFFNQNLNFSQYTRPASFLGMKVPSVLLSGNHEKIQQWRTNNSSENTCNKRPELINTISDKQITHSESLLGQWLN